jgi:hypothetical protein
VMQHMYLLSTRTSTSGFHKATLLRHSEALAELKAKQAVKIVQPGDAEIGEECSFHV